MKHDKVSSKNITHGYRVEPPKNKPLGLSTQGAESEAAWNCSAWLGAAEAARSRKKPLCSPSLGL